MEAAETVTGVFFTAVIGFKLIVFTFRKDEVETERHTVKPEEIQSINTEPDGSTRLAIRLHRDLTIPASKDESAELQIALQRVLGEVKAVELRRIEAGREARVEKLPERRGPLASSEDYEKIPDD